MEPDIITVDLSGMSSDLRRKAVVSALEVAGYSPLSIRYYMIHLENDIDRVSALSFEKIEE